MSRNTPDSAEAMRIESSFELQGPMRTPRGGVKPPPRAPGAPGAALERAAAAWWKDCTSIAGAGCAPSDRHLASLLHDDAFGGEQMSVCLKWDDISALRACCKGRGVDKCLERPKLEHLASVGPRLGRGATHFGRWK